MRRNNIIGNKYILYLSLLGRCDSESRTSGLFSYRRVCQSFAKSRVSDVYNSHISVEAAVLNTSIRNPSRIGNTT